MHFIINSHTTENNSPETKAHPNHSASSRAETPMLLINQLGEGVHFWISDMWIGSMLKIQTLHCGVTNNLLSLSAPKRITLFWVGLFATGFRSSELTELCTSVLYLATKIHVSLHTYEDISIHFNRTGAFAHTKHVCCFPPTWASTQEGVSPIWKSRISVHICHNTSVVGSIIVGTTQILWVNFPTDYINCKWL